MKTIKLFLVWLLATSLISAATINIPSEQPTIQAGINAAANGDTVLVNPGIYVENINFYGKSIVVGSLFLITGDTSYISLTVIDGNKQNSVVMFENGESNASVLIGFSIINGQGKEGSTGVWPRDDIGGGLTCKKNSSPILMHLKVFENTAPVGGGVYVNESQPRLENVIISKNKASTGAGIYCYYGAAPILKNVFIIDNEATYGGGIGCSNNSKPDFENVVITENKATDGGGIHFFDNSDLILRSVSITKNNAFNRGGGIYVDISNVSFSSTDRSNIYLNHGGIGSDICIAGSQSSPTMSVIVDTFAVTNPTGYHVFPFEKFTFDILNSKIEPVNKDLYVSPTGNDLNSGVLPSEPLRTVSFAMSIISSSNPHTIHIAKGIYSTSTGEHFPINMKDNISLLGESKEDVILDAEGQGSILYFNSVQGNKVENLSLTKGNSYSGGAINCTNSSPDLGNLTLYRNNATNYGGGIYCEQSSPIITNVTIFDNEASWGGGGIFCINNSKPVIENTTISRNSAKFWAGAVYSEGESNPHLINTILWNNFPHEIRLLYGFVTIEYSDVEGGIEEIINNTNANWLEGNINSNPLFCNPLEGIFTLGQNSPCLETGKDGNNIGALDLGCDSIFIDEISSTLYVSVNGTDSTGDGSLKNPFATIQHAINTINAGDTILVYPGTYFENLLLYKKGIVLSSFFTVTGDTSYISQTVINGTSSGCVVAIVNGDSTTKLCGLTIANGKSGEGGGIACSNSSPEISNVRITGNFADIGGGISAVSSNFKLINSVISNNRSIVSGGGLRASSSNPLISNVIIANNSSEGSNGGCIFYSSVPHFKNVTITGNRAFYNGGGISLYASSSAIFDSVERCNIYLNYASRGSDIDYSDFDDGVADFIVYADTFTVKNPSDYHAHGIEQFDILHGKLTQSEKDLYVSAAGNNDNTGESPSEPLRSVSLALAKIRVDSLNPRTIYIADGKYSPSLTGEFFPMNIPDDLSLKGESASSVVLDAESSGGGLSFDNNNNNNVENLTITGGYKFEGGGISCTASNPNFIEVVITKNKAISNGGGIICSENSSPVFINCTISSNEADFGGGISFFSSCASLSNTILWDNSPDEIHFWGQGTQSCADIEYTNVLDGSIITNNNGEVKWGQGNLSLDPLFCNPFKGNYSLAENSPCVGSGKDGKNIGALPVGCITVDVERIPQTIPIDFGLLQNYPNPFNPSTTIKYELPKDSEVKLVIYNMLGEKVDELINTFQKAGRYEVEWDAGKFASGVYIYQIKADDFISSKKLLLLK